MRVNFPLIATTVKPYRKYAVLVVALSFLAAAIETLSVGMLIPLLGSLQQYINKMLEPS